MKANNVALLLCYLMPVLAVSLWFGAGWWLSVQDKREGERERVAMGHGRMLGFLMEEYCQDHEGRFPDAAHWEQALKPYLHGDSLVLTIDAPLGHAPRRFAMNKNLSGRMGSTLKASYAAVLFFESVATGPNAADNLQSLPRQETDGGKGISIIYADGHGYSYPYAWEKQDAKTRRECLGE